MPVSKKIMIARKLFGDDRNDSKDVHENETETLEPVTNKLRVPRMNGVYQEGAAARKQRRVFKIKRKAIDRAVERRLCKPINLV